MSVTVDTHGLDDWDRKIDRGTQRALKLLAPKLQRWARTHHEYHDRSGTLTAGTFVDAIYRELRGYATPEYAGHVADHYNDPWIQDTIRDNWDEINRTIQDCVTQELNR